MAKRKALMVGINAYGGGNDLNGCINDVMLVNDIITNKYGFTDSTNKRMLTDASATTANIVDRLHWLVDDAQPGDVLLFHYSGHGTQVVDVDYNVPGSQPELMEAICPVDLDWRTKIIKDKDFKAIFSKVPFGVNLTVILDSCHSGSGLRELINPNTPNRHKFIEMPADIANRGFGLNLALKPRCVQDPHVIDYEDQTGILIAGCKSTQTSADAWIHNRYDGACTYYLAKVLGESNYDITYTDLVDKMNVEMGADGYEQNPELDSPAALMTKKVLQPFV